MTRFLWIASYPKSGNTWVRFILTNLLHGPVARSGEIDAFVPDVHKTPRGALRPVYRDVMFFKTHWPAVHLAAYFERSAGAVYVVRNPLDLVCSCLNYWSVDRAKRAPAVEEFAVNRGMPAWIRSGIDSVPRNIASWVDAPLPFPRLLLRYEDLMSAPNAAVARLCRFLAHDAGEAEIASAVTRSSFAALRAIEEAEVAAGADGFFDAERRHNRITDPAWRFMNRGRTGGYKEVLSAAEVDMLAHAFAGVMAEFGYSLDAAGDLVVSDDYPALARLPATAAF